MTAFHELSDRIKRAAERCGKRPPQLLAVSKMQSIEKMISVYHEGQRAFGENYVQELVEKRKQFLLRGIEDAEFHFIGRLQSNKVKILLPHAAVIHSIDSKKLLKEIDQRSEELKLRPKVFFQVNIDHEESKSGFLPDQLDDLVSAVKISQFVLPQGLMAIPDPHRDPEKAFQRMQDLSQKYGSVLGFGLSMGMSSDFEIAIREGSSWIRVGTALFGKRD